MLEIKPQDPTVHLFVYMRFGQRPTAQDYDLNATISHDEKCVCVHYNATVNLSHTREKDLVLVESEGSAPASSLKIHHPPYPRVKMSL